MKTVAVVPARYASTRFPGKLMKDLGGVPVLVRTVRQVMKATRLDDVRVATDDHRIARLMEKEGIPYCMTRDDHVSGTDRIGEAVETFDANLIVNIQGDEPFVSPSLIDELVGRMNDGDRPEMGTACTPIHSPGELEDPSVVKVVRDINGLALYFSRSLIPHARDETPSSHLGADVYFRHLGLYAYRAAFFARWKDMKPHPLEQIEKLEQLRALAHGVRIAVVETDQTAPGIDTPADLQAAEAFLREHPERSI